MKEKANKTYFEQFNHKMKKRFDELEDNLELEAPILMAIGKSENYNVPDSYFEQNHQKLQKLNHSKNASKKKRLVYLMAASFLMIGVISWHLYNPEIVQEEIEYVDITDHYLDNIDDIDLDLLLSIDDDDLSDIDFGMMTDEEVEIYWSYLLEDVSDIDLTNIL